MTGPIKKMNLGLAGIFMAASPLCANDDSCCKPKCAPVCPPKQCCESSSCCPPTCNASPYCGPNCIPEPYCGEFNVKGELLYWTASLGGLEAAFGNTQVATTVSSTAVITTTIKESDVHPESEWRPGYRVGADLAFGCFDLEADWTHYDGRSTFHEDGQHGHWKIKYDTIDVLFARRFSIAPCFAFKPFIGIRGLKVHQTLKSHLETFFLAGVVGNNTVFTVKNDKEKFWGLGPEFGVEADWYIGCGFDLFASFDVVTYYGTVRGSNYDVNTFPTTVSVSNGTRNRYFNNIGTDAAVGIRWDTAWTYCDYDILFMLKLAAEQHRIYDFSDLGSDGTLSLDGGVAAVGLGIRY